MQIECIKGHIFPKYHIIFGETYVYTLDDDGDLAIVIDGLDRKKTFLFKDSHYFVRNPEHAKTLPLATDYFDNEQLMLIRLSRK